VRQRSGFRRHLRLPAEVRQGFGPQFAEFQAFAGVVDKQQ